MVAAHAAVTGGSSGIGAAVVDRFRARGLHVSVLDLQEPGTPRDGVDHYAVDVTEARTPLARLYTPDEMARSIEHLALDASFGTGVCLPVDGGWTSVGE